MKTYEVTIIAWFNTRVRAGNNASAECFARRTLLADLKKHKLAAGKGTSLPFCVAVKQTQTIAT